MEDVEILADERGVVVRTLFSLRFVLSVLMVCMYSSGIITWKVSSDSATDAVNDLSDKLMTEIRSHIKTALTHHLDVAETVTLANARIFSTDLFSEHDVPYFMQVFKTQLDAYKKSITTVSMTTKLGHLHGVYTDSVGVHKGFWSSNTSASGKVQLYDFNTTLPLPHEGLPGTPRLLYVEGDYNSSEQEWYTVCNVSVPYDKAWTSIYTMGSQTPVTMLSESTVSYTRSGLMGVTTIDMALGFAGELLRNVQLPVGYKAFVVDVKDVARQGGVQAVIGTADNTPLLYCRMSALETSPMLGGVACKGTIQFVPVNESVVDYIKTSHDYVVSRVGAWDYMSGVSDTLVVSGDKHFISISAIERNNLKWCVVILLPESVFLEEINKTKVGLLLMYISVLIVKAFLSAVVVYFFIAPLHRLAAELELLSEFRMSEDSVEMSGWTEIRTLQLTFITLLKQMKVIKSYMPQALFVQDDSSAGSDKTTMSFATHTQRTDSRGGTGTRGGSVVYSPAQQAQARALNSVSRTFDYKKHLTVMSIKVAYPMEHKDVDRLHAAHCIVLEAISESASSCKGTLDQISSDCFSVIWGRENFANLTNVTQTVERLLSFPLPGALAIGCVMGPGMTGSAGGNTIRTVATLTETRAQSFFLASLGAYHRKPLLFTKKIRDQTEITHMWEVCDVVKFDNAKHPDVIFIFEGAKEMNEDQEWLYQMADNGVDKVAMLMIQLCADIKAVRVKEARDVVARVSALTLTPERAAVIKHLREMVESDCLPVAASFSYERKLLHGKGA